jgi:hypothetical protein
VEEERSGRRRKGGRGYQPRLPQFLTASREINLARMAPFLDRPTPDWLMTLTICIYLLDSFTRLLVYSLLSSAAIRSSICYYSDRTRLVPLDLLYLLFVLSEIG